MQADLTLSIISADNLELLLPCLQSIFDNTGQVSLQVFVVDNASSDGTAAAVSDAFPEINVIQNLEKLGFSSNNNLVLEQSQGRYAMLLNDDTLVRAGALDHMVAYMDAHPHVGAAGAYLLNPDGSFQPSYARFPHPLLEGLLPTTIWTHRITAHNGQPFAVDSVCGAAMLVRRQAMQEVGLLDTAFDPIYSEEVDWCYRIKKAGWEIVTLPQAEIIHYGSQTMNRVVPRKYELLLSHKLHYFRKHNGSVAANIYRAALGLTTVTKLLWWSLRQTLPARNRHSREKRDLHWYLLKRLPTL